jgi:ribosomal protein L7/L12
MYVEQEVAELRRQVAKLERQVVFLMQQLSVTYVDAGDPIPPEVIEMVRRGKTMDAIKLYREATGVSLKEAKAFIESL